MTHLSSAEMAVLNFWYGYIRLHAVESIRPMLVFYLMTEMLIEYNQQLPDKRRPVRPSEDAVMRIGATSGSLSKWRRKWLKIWLNVHQEWVEKRKSSIGRIISESLLYLCSVVWKKRRFCVGKKEIKESKQRKIINVLSCLLYRTWRTGPYNFWFEI